MRLTRGAARAGVAGLGVAAALAGALLGASPAHAGANEVGDPTGPVSIAMIVPVTVPVSTQGSGLIPADTLATDTAQGGVLTRELDAVTGTSAVLAVDPMIVASIRVLGTTMPASARDWLARLEGLPNEKFPLAYADADPGVLAHTPGGVDLLQHLDFQFAIDPGRFGPPQTQSPTPSPPATPSGSPSATPPAPTGPTPLPTDADILAGDYVADDIAWPASGTVSTADVDPLVAAGYHAILVSSGNVSSSTSARVGLGGIDGLVSDDGLSTIAREAIQAVGDTALQQAMQRFDAALTGMAATTPGRSVIATLDRGWSVDSGHVHALLQNVDLSASARSIGLSTILAGPKTDAKIVDGTIPDDGGALLGRVVGTVPTEAAFATVAGAQADRITAPRRLQLLSTVSVTWVESDTGWADRLRAYLESSTALLAKVKIVHGSSVLFTAASTTIPVTVSNALPVPVTVLVTVEPQRTTLQISGGDVQLKVEPDATARALVPAQAISTGKVRAEISLHSAADPTVAIGETDTITVNLRPSWEGIGTVIIVVLLVLIFGGGIARQVVRRRRARAARREAAIAETGAGSDSDSGSEAATDAEPAPPSDPAPDAVDRG